MFNRYAITPIFFHPLLPIYNNFFAMNLLCNFNLHHFCFTIKTSIIKLLQFKSLINFIEQL